MKAVFLLSVVAAAVAAKSVYFAPVEGPASTQLFTQPPAVSVSALDTTTTTGRT